jgi:hypothetical protein
MSRGTMTARAAELPRAPLYGIGRFQAGSEQVDFEIGWPELERDTQWAQAQLQRAGLGAGDAVLLTALACEGPWFGPVVRALRALRITYLPAEVYAFDAGRSASLLQQFDVKAFIGLGAETVDGWVEKELSASDVLSGVELIWARPAALGQLAGVNAKVAPILPVGPALAMGAAGERDAEVNGSEWRIDEQDGELRMSNAADRAATFDRAPTGVRGVVTQTDGRLLVGLTE